ncbi:unnamed protein product [Prunus brigantina]
MDVTMGTATTAEAMQWASSRAHQPSRHIQQAQGGDKIGCW